jgi:hypothetical protein
MKLLIDIPEHIYEHAKETTEDSNDEFDAMRAIANGTQQESRSENPNRWIPVSERLPEDGEEVLCFLDSEEMAVLFRRNNWGQYEWVDGGFATGAYDVVAWMPLPTPYKAEGSEE